MFYFIRDRNKETGTHMSPRIKPLSDASSNTHNYLRYAGGRTVVRMPLRMQALQASLLFIELLMSIALLVCGTVKIMAKSHLYMYSNAIYFSLLAIMAVFAGLFANRHNAGRNSHIIHSVLGALSSIGFAWILYVNILELKEDQKIDRPVPTYETTVGVSVTAPINMTTCRIICAQGGAGSANYDCKCTFNRDATRAEYASACMIVINIISFIISATVAVCAAREMCGTVHEELREKPPPPVKVPRFRQPMNQMVIESRI